MPASPAAALLSSTRSMASARPVVIAAIVLEQYLGLTGADPVFGVAIALWLAWGAFKASSSAIDQLMDKEWPEDQRAAFLDIAARQPGLRGIHDFRTRRSGTHDFAQFHMEVDARLTVAAASRLEQNETTVRLDLRLVTVPEADWLAKVRVVSQTQPLLSSSRKTPIAASAISVSLTVNHSEGARSGSRPAGSRTSLPPAPTPASARPISIRTPTV